MLKIRFQRFGKKNMPYYRLVIAESHRAAKGKFLEVLGNYDPRKKTAAVAKEKVLRWISKGAQVSDSAHNFLVKQQVIKGKKIAKHNVPKEEAKDAAGEKAAKNPSA